MIIFRCGQGITNHSLYSILP